MINLGCHLKKWNFGASEMCLRMWISGTQAANLTGP